MKNRLIRFLPLFFLFGVSCAPKAIKKDTIPDVLNYVDPFIGTGFHGHTFPGAVVPNGRVQLSPDTHLFGWEASSGYHYQDTTLYGFSHTHLSGTGIGDLGDILFLPFTGKTPKKKPVGSFSHDTEKAIPGYYKVDVAPWNIQAELSATLRTGWHKYRYPKDSQAKVMVDLEHVLQSDWGHKVLEGEIKIIDEYTIEGYRLTSGWAANDPIWFTCKFNQPIKESEIRVDGKALKTNHGKGKDVTAYFSFGKIDKPLLAKVSLSSVDQQGATKNMEEASAFTSLEQVKKAAQDTWREKLSKILLETKDQAVLTNFYSALYHTNIAPMIFCDIDGRYRGMNNEINTTQKNNAYTVYSLWDTFRSWYPLMTITEPDRAKDWAYDLYRHQKEGGLLPKWPLNANYTGTMVGYPAVAILADAFEKNMIDSIPDKLLDAAVISSSWNPDFKKTHKDSRAEKVMTPHIYYKEKTGFVPMDKCTESVSFGLEMAYYDWCIAHMATLAGKDSLAQVYSKKGKAYQTYYDKETKFMRGKNSDGSWDQDFNPRYSNHQKSAYVEGNAYQWTPFVPHDPNGLATLMGGPKELGVWLDSLFTTSSHIEGEHASGDITGLIGQYAHGNEPSHHIPYMYQYSDRPYRTQEILDTILYHFYQPTPEGIIGNEDCGQMSAWYVLNALGIYQMAPGNGTFYIGRPLMDKARIKVKSGWFTIEVINNSPKNKYISRVTLNGEALPNNRFNYRDIRKDATLKIFMKDTPEIK